MSGGKKYTDLKYEDKKQTLEDFLKLETLPVVARTCYFGRRQEHIEIPEDTEVLFQNTPEETFAHIKVLTYYDNEKEEEEFGAEYVLEHETFVGNEYLMPLTFDRQIKYVSRPGSRRRYLTIKQVISDCPAFIRAEDETMAHLSSDETQTVTIPANSVLELIRIYSSKTHDTCLECTDGCMTYMFSEYEQVNFSLVEQNKLYSLSEMSPTTVLPKVVLFQDVSPVDIVLKDNELRSAMVTIVNGPIEILGHVKVKYVTCWIRNKNLQTYETMLIPEDMWNKTYVQMRYFHSDDDKESYISQKYGSCLQSDFVCKSLYVFPLTLCNSVWLRSPDLFKQKLDGNVFFEVIKVPFTYSSDEDDNIYSEIEEPRPPVPKRDRNGTSNIKTIKSTNGTELKTTELEEDILKPSLMSQRNESSTKRDQKYTSLEFKKAERVYDKLGIYGDSAPKLLPLSNSDNPVEKSEQYIELSQVRKVMDDKQTKDDFFNYSVKEVSFCFEHCGLKSLADMCYKKKLDGSFFKGFEDWKELDISSLDVIIVKKVIYQGWRSKDDSAYGVGTRM